MSDYNTSKYMDGSEREIGLYDMGLAYDISWCMSVIEQYKCWYTGAHCVA